MRHLNIIPATLIAMSVVACSAEQTETSTEIKEERARKVYDESKDGEMSKDCTNPTVIALNKSGVVKSTVLSDETGNYDCFQVVVPEGKIIKDITLESADFGEADVGGLVIAEGTFADASPSTSSADGYLGWAHIRQDNVHGPSLLDELAASNTSVSPATGFDYTSNEGFVASAGFGVFSSETEYTASLPAGSYSFWLRNTAAVTTEIEFKVGKAPKCKNQSKYYQESCSGDLSNDPANPTDIGTLRRGTTKLDVTWNKNPDASLADLDFLTFTVKEGEKLTRIRPKSWTGSPVFEDVGAFIIREGSSFDTTNNGAVAPGFVGWAHFRADNVNGNLLDEIAISNDCDALIAGPFAGDANLTGRCEGEAQRANAALATGLPEGYVGPGTYTVWFRQGSATNINSLVELKVQRCRKSDAC